MNAALFLLLAQGAFAQTSLDSAYASAARDAQAAAARPAAAVDPKALGSWFRKIASVEDPAVDGIAASGVLPAPSFDPGRMHRPAAGEPAYTQGPLDSPGVYVGAHAQGREVDAGLKWDHRYDGQGRDTGLWAWRLFWRVATPAGNVWRNPRPGAPDDVYLEPGDAFQMTLTVRPDGTARLDAGGASGAVTEVFPLDGFFKGSERLPRRFKRVDSIDQFTVLPDGTRHGLEGSPAVPTKATLSDGRWDSVVLLRGNERLPLTGRRAVEWRGPAEDSFPATVPDGKGGEAMALTPPRP